jgi:hypothetical protein
MTNIYKHGNINECCKKQTFLIYIVHLLDKTNINQIHFTTSAQYPITSTEMHTYVRGPVKLHRCACPVYRPAHHRNWLQLLTPTLNTANCHMYMSTAVPAEVQCYITQWYSVILHSGTVPLYTRRNILNRNTILRLYIYKIIFDITSKDKQTLFHYSRLCHKRSLLTSTTTTTTTNTTTNTTTPLGIFVVF